MAVNGQLKADGIDTLDHLIEENIDEVRRADGDPSEVIGVLNKHQSILEEDGFAAYNDE